VETAEAEAYEIVRAVMGLTRTEVVGADVDDADAARLVALATRRVEGIPLQYLTGRAAFRHLDLKVGPGVLIPRPETEIVVERVLARLPIGGLAVDVGTGSGAIALSIAYERPDARVLATERAADALRWAQLNRDELGLTVEVLPGDLLDGLSPGLRGTIDVVVSNPPYIAESERGMLAASVVDHEPHEALFAGHRGTALIERLADDARAWLRAGGWLVSEIAPHQADLVRRMLGGLGYVEVTIGKDLAGRDRVAEARS
jgi:release factor glutamine methyltransferase